MTVLMRLILPCLALPLLAGCTAITALGEASRPLQIYELQTPIVQQAAGRRRAVELIVEEPFAGGSLNTERILIRPTPVQAQYLPDVRWADTAPVMLQTLLVRSLSETGAWSSVGRRPVGTRADYAVLGELTDFHAVPADDGDTATVRVRLILRIVREGDARVVATRSFTASEPTEATDPTRMVAAFDRATAQLLSEIVPWIIARTVG